MNNFLMENMLLFCFINLLTALGINCTAQKPKGQKIKKKFNYQIIKLFNLGTYSY